MSELYLIAHRVRSEPAFDVATRIECPECKQEDEDVIGCAECDHLGFWWIIPTSGHRAYPWWDTPLSCQMQDDENVQLVRTLDLVSPMPPDLPDHYTHSASPQPALDISALVKAKPISIRRS